MTMGASLQDHRLLCDALLLLAGTMIFQLKMLKTMSILTRFGKSGAVRISQSFNGGNLDFNEGHARRQTQ